VTYNVAEPTVRDRIRGRIGDTSNDVATEAIADVTYDSVITFATNEWRATAEMGGRLLRILNGEVKSYAESGIFTVTFRDPSDLEARIAGWLRLAEAEEAASHQAMTPNLVAIEADIFFGDGAEW
jgi:hypothetical protein